MLIVYVYMYNNDVYFLQHECVRACV